VRCCGILRPPPRGWGAREGCGWSGQDGAAAPAPPRAHSPGRPPPPPPTMLDAHTLAVALGSLALAAALWAFLT